MNNILYTTFANQDDGIRAAEALLHHGVRPEDIKLILPRSQCPGPERSLTPLEGIAAAANPQPAETVSAAPVPNFEAGLAATIDLPYPPELPPWPRYRVPHYYGNRDLMAAGASGYRYDALGAVILDPVPQKAAVSTGNISREVTVGTEEGAGLGIGLGFLTVLCIPAIGLLTGAGVIVMGLMAGGIAGGIYGYLTGSGVARGIARIMSDHIDAGGAALSVTVSDAQEEAALVGILVAHRSHLLRTNGETK